MTETPRDAARAITDLAGIPDAPAEEAFTRLLAAGGRGGWFSLTQADFDQAQDAFDDAIGRPRRKHKNPIGWKIGFWWHWRVVDPIIYPALEALAFAWWLLIRQWLPGGVRLIAVCEPAAAIQDVSRVTAWARTRHARRRGCPTRHGDRIRFQSSHRLFFITLPDPEALAAYRAAHPNARTESETRP